MDAAVSAFRDGSSVEIKLQRAREELLDLSARNRLLNVPRSSKSAKTIEIVDEMAGEVFRLLVREGKAFTFLPGKETRGDQTSSNDEDEETLVDLPQPDDDEIDERGVAARHADTKLQTRMTSKGLQKRLFDLHSDARTLEEEQGVNILFLALGTLKWSDPQHGTVFRYAPLVLLPVSLERGTAGERFKLRWRQEEQTSNLSLEAYLDRVHGLRLPPFDGGDDFDPVAYMTGVAAAISTKPGWEVAPDDMILGFFSFAKFLMYRDLDPDNWPDDGKISTRPLIRSLLVEGFDAREPLVPDDAPIDTFIAPKDMLHIVDCDSSQTLAVHDVRSGRNLVIQGPPGTGKSQTIANVIASAIADGKTVLFVAEKMAALEVVKRRLDHAGVGDACLELHSNKANKRLFLEELKRTWSLGAPRGDFPDGLLTRLLEARDGLNGHAARLHRRHPAAALSPYQVIGHLVRLRQGGRKPTSLVLERPETWTPEGRRERMALLGELTERIDDIGTPATHPWRGVGLDMVLPTALERLVDRITDLLERIRKVRAATEDLAAQLRRPSPDTPAEISPLVALARRLADAPDLRPAAFTAEVWRNVPVEIDTLLRLGASFAKLSEALSGKIRPEEFRTSIEGLADRLGILPSSYSSAGFGRLQALTDVLPRLMAEAERLRVLLGSDPGALSLASIRRSIATGDRVAEAPDASPEAFAATVWDHGVEQAADLAEAVQKLEAVRHDIGAAVTDAAWSTDVGAARQALATHNGLFRHFSGDWRRARSLIKTILRRPDAPTEDVIAVLDGLVEARRAADLIRDNDGFGRSAFGADWRGERSASAPLLALVAWMRTLRGIGAEPRIIAGRLQDRSAIRNHVGRLQRFVEEANALLEQTWSDLGASVPMVFGADASLDQLPLQQILTRIDYIAAADAASRDLMIETPAFLRERLDVLGRLARWQDAEKVIESRSELGSTAFADAWAGTASDWGRLAAVAAWMSKNADIASLAADLGAARKFVAATSEHLLADLSLFSADFRATAGDLKADPTSLFASQTLDAVSLGTLEDRLCSWQGNAEQLSKWIAYRERADRATALGLGSIVRELHDGRLVTGDALPNFETAYFEALLNDMIAHQPELGRFDGHLHGKLAREFADLDRQRIAASALEVVRTHHRKIPPKSGVGPLGILNGEMARKRGHMPIRQLMGRAAPAIQALKPVLMMSPLSVAQFLPPGTLTFDLLVMDEASQIQPVDALGAIARCRQVVVVGDERQLPPTAFFAKMTGGQSEDDEGDGAQVGDIESILGLFSARGLPQRMLRWHYRSRHQSLIAVSNSEFYENRLFIVPSPYTMEAGMGLQFHHLPDGRFDSGGTGTNMVEAKAVAEAIIRHAKSEPRLSLGVATFSIRQRRAIQDELEVLRRLNPDTEEFFHAHPNEPFFVKNLENVQGDERDVIVISVGYGKNASGQMAMRFGPLSSEGGERRLNVLISRAKRRCVIYSSITDEDIDLERAKGKGVFAFKLFLHFARTGRLVMAEASGRDHDSVFEAQVASALQARGYQVHPQVGIAGFFIDLGVADPERPGRYVLGIECDGDAYHRSQSARDRDRLRQAVLEDHGWIIYRIWSTDWFQRPREQLDQLIDAIEAAKAALEERLGGGQHQERAVPVEVITVDRGDVVEIGLVDAQTEASLGAPYVEASPRPLSGYDIHDAPVARLAELVEDVVRVEGPVHIDEVVNRTRSAWGLLRSGARIQAAVERAAEVAAAGKRVIRSGDFLEIPDGEIRVRDRSAVASANLRKPEMLPPREIGVAIEAVIGGSFGATRDEVVQSVSRIFGFKATSAVLRDLIGGVLDALIANGKVTPKGEMLIFADENNVTSP